MMNLSQSTHYYQFNNGKRGLYNIEVPLETSVHLNINGEYWLSFACTPCQIEELAIGFLYNESLIESITEIVDIRVCPNQDNIDIWLNHPLEKPTVWHQTSGCSGGISFGYKGSTINLKEILITPFQVNDLSNKLLEFQKIHQKSGGIHTSAVSDGNQLFIVAQDIGRHNTLDKLSGALLLGRNDIPRFITITTGRISSEMVRKSLRLGSSIVISRTAPSSSALELAKEVNQTIIGYARSSNFRIYSCPERITTNDN